LVGKSGRLGVFGLFLRNPFSIFNCLEYINVLVLCRICIGL
jgi:hypothetical protein